MPPWSHYVVKTPSVGLHNSRSPTVPIIPSVSLLYLLLGSRYTSANNSRQLLLANAEEHTNGQVQDGKEREGEAGKEPELNTNVLLGASTASPVRDAATLGLGAKAVAREARIIALAVPTLAVTVA